MIFAAVYDTSLILYALTPMSLQDISLNGMGSLVFDFT
jgi:hypothetical protein